MSRKSNPHPKHSADTLPRAMEKGGVWPEVLQFFDTPNAQPHGPYDTDTCINDEDIDDETPSSHTPDEAERQDGMHRHLGLVDAEKAPVRLDRWLALALPTFSRTRLKALIEQCHVTVDGEGVKTPNRRLKGGEAVSLYLPAAAPAVPRPQDIALHIVHEDESVVVVDKPAGMVVHPAPGSLDGTLVNALLHHCASSLSGVGGIRRPGIVHRIDKDTSGLLVIAKNDTAHHGLAGQFAAHTVDRAYWALVWGTPHHRHGEITGNIGRNPYNRKKMAVVTEGGKAASTRYSVLQTMEGGALSLVECRLNTGRTHQIRVHMTHIGHPLVGDQVYGSQRRQKSVSSPVQHLLENFHRQALHAYRLGFIHPVSGTPLCFASALSADIATLIEGSGGVVPLKKT